MKYFLILSILSPLLYANTVEYLTRNQDAMAEVYAIPEVQSRLKQCREYHKERSTDNEPSNIFRCLVEGEKKAQGYEIEPISENLLKTIMKGMDIEDPKGPEFEGLQITEVKGGESDPALKNLEAFFTEKLRKGLYGDVQNGVYGVIDHSVFHDLYEKQVGKNIISGISSYCIEATPTRAFILYENLEKNQETRKDNLTLLKEYQDNINQAYQNWNLCMNSLQQICHAGELKNEENKILFDFKGLEESPPKVKKGDDPSPLIFSINDVEYSRQRACTLIRFIKDSRQTLIKVAKIKNLLANLADPKTSIDLENPAVINLNFTEEDTLDRILQTSSKEFLYGGDKKSFKTANDSLIRSFEAECVKAGSNLDKCQKHFLNRTEAEKAATEVALKTQAMVRKLEKYRDDKDKLEIYLTEEGYTEEEIEDILKDTNAFNRIIQNYETERKYFIDALSSRINERSLPGEKDGALPEFDSQEVQNRIKTIQKEIESRSEKYEQLIHYTNIIEGHMGLKDEEGKPIDDKNLAIIFKEINDRLESSNEKKEYSIGIEDIKILHTRLIENGMYSDTTPSLIESLPVELLNAQVLTYSSTVNDSEDQELN